MAQIALFALLATVVHLLVLVPFARRAPVVVLVLVGAVLAVAAYQLWAYVDLGHLDPFFMIASAIEFAIALVIGIVIAVLVKRYSSATVSSP